MVSSVHSKCLIASENLLKAVFDGATIFLIAPGKRTLTNVWQMRVIILSFTTAPSEGGQNKGITVTHFLILLLMTLVTRLNGIAHQDSGTSGLL